MNVQQTVRTLLGLPPKTSILLESNHGLGKSSVVAQAAAIMSQKLNKPFGFIDFRLAQCEIGDLIGMQRHAPQAEVTTSVYKDGVRVEVTRQAVNVTVHDLAEWFPTDPDSCGFLFLDELARAPRDVQNAVLELALDYRYHFRSLPIGWRVISANNSNMDVYSGTQLDPALYDRFATVQFKPTFDEWVEFAEKEGCHRAVLTYLSKFTADLGLDTIPEAGKKTPTPRSWMKFSSTLKYMAENGDDLFKDHNYLHLICKGFIGDIATNFVDYVKKNYKVYNAEDILNKYTDEMDVEFKAMLVTEIAFYSKEISGHVKKTGKNLTKKQGENLFRFYTAIPKEAAGGFWSLFSSEVGSAAAAWYRMEKDVLGKKTTPVQDYTFNMLAKSQALK